MGAAEGMAILPAVITPPAKERSLIGERPVHGSVHFQASVLLKSSGAGQVVESLAVAVCGKRSNCWTTTLRQAVIRNREGFYDLSSTGGILKRTARLEMDGAVNGPLSNQ